MAPSTTEAGNRAEERAVAFLERAGYGIVARNFSTRQGELDIVAVDGDCLVFVEVRSRVASAHGHPIETVGVRKQRQIAKMATIYLERQSPTQRDIRFDVIGVVGDKIDHVIDAFTVDGEW